MVIMSKICLELVRVCPQGVKYCIRDYVYFVDGELKIAEVNFNISRNLTIS